MRLFLIITLFCHLMISSSVWAQQKLTDEEMQMLEKTQKQSETDTESIKKTEQTQTTDRFHFLLGLGLGAPFSHGLMLGASLQIDPKWDIRVQGAFGFRWVETSAMVFHQLTPKHALGLGYHFNYLFYTVADFFVSSHSPFLLASAISLNYKYQYSANGKSEIMLGLSANLEYLSHLDALPPQLLVYYFLAPTIGFIYKF
jgi:hypothetical protein